MDDVQARLRVVLWTLCCVQGLVIDNCYNNKLEIFEDTPVPVTCGEIRKDVDVMWLNDYGTIGDCKSQGRCTNRLDYNLSRLQRSTESQLTILTNYRTHAGLKISCREMRSSYTVSCTLVIKRHSVLTGCHVNLNNVTRLMSGSCGVQEAHSSDNNYSCTWTVNSAIITTRYDVKPFDNCSFTQPVQGIGLYNYTILVNPPSTTGFSQSVVTVDTVTEVTKVTEVTINSPSSLSTDTGVIFSTSPKHNIYVTQGGSTVSKKSRSFGSTVIYYKDDHHRWSCSRWGCYHFLANHRILHTTKETIARSENRM